MKIMESLVKERLFLSILLLFFHTLSINAQGSEEFQGSSFDHGHTFFKEVLVDHLLRKGHQTYVNYKEIKDNPSKLDFYINNVTQVKRKTYKSWTEKQQLAFLINAYNALTLKLVSNHYPVKSIKDIGGWFSSPWEKEFFTLFGKETHLDYIEHELIRKNFKEPRIHFAVNCASMGCPPLRVEPYVASKLEEQLKLAANDFLKNPDRNRYDPRENKLYVSKIFDWYGDDFKKAGYSSWRHYVSTFLSKKEEYREKIKKSAGVIYLPYDWSLNDFPDK